MTRSYFKTALLALVAAAMMFTFSCGKENGTKTKASSPTAKFAPTETSDAERAAGVIDAFGGPEVPNIIDVVVDDILGGVVAGAEVTLNGTVHLTDENGRAQITDATIRENFGHVKVHKAGFFDGSRTFAAVDAEHGAAVSIAIKLFPLGEPTTVVAGSPSIVNVPTPYGDAHIDLSGEYLDDDGSPYAGNVLVYAKYLDPLAPETNATMPGALLAVNAQNEMVPLISYGMLNVQLIGDAGQELQIGSPATLRTPIHPDQLAGAPDNIPMWYFNETAGVWIEEGVGTRDGDDYVAEVSHFTWWNWDMIAASNTCNLFIKVINLCGDEVVGAIVNVPGYGSGAYMGEAGHNYVYPNSSVTVDASFNVGGITYSGTQTITTGSASSSNHVTITLNFGAWHIVGGLLDCLGNPILTPASSITITSPLGSWTIGPFVGAYLCTYVGPPGVLTLVGNNGPISSLPVSVSLNTSNCGSVAQDITICPERIEYSINGLPVHTDNLTPWGQELTPTDMYVEAFDRVNPMAKTRIESHITTVGTGYNYGTAPGEMEFTAFSDPAGMSPVGNGITFDLVQYPPVLGGMIEIDFSGPYDDNAGATKTISGKAYIKRR